MMSAGRQLLVMHIFTTVHMDNLEQYTKDDQHSSKVLTSSLVLGAQQSMSKNSSMKLNKTVDDWPSPDESALQFLPSDKELD